ncbi:uncharacterized protein LOC107607168 [Arachis ipaensis]|uniref:uncharacterized protein LOC107607168 n=1 Tax=Arachis ipaensis TaxID=130454 RepID=UPI0007AFC15A|nr:uncharacterized protein LOC107607168 [Arachis ipaensis]
MNFFTGENPLINYQTYQPPHQRQPPQPNQSQAPQITYPSTSPNQDDTLRSILQGQKELQTTLASGLTGLTSTLQALLARMEPSTSTPQASSSSAIPSQPLPNPNGGINAITLRSETKLQERNPKAPIPMIVTQDEEGIEIEEIEKENEAQEVVEDEVPQPRGEVSKDEKVLEEEVAQPIPFPTLARKAKKRVELDPKMVEIIHELETIPLGSSISALMGALPEKCGDSGPCMVTCTIDGVQFIDCMCDLGACVSIIPLFVYHILKLPPLKRSAARFVLADKSIITVTDIAEDVLVNIKGLIFLTDFYILEMPPSESERTSSILLGRPFWRTSRFKLDVYSGTYSFEIDGRVVSFSLDEAMRHPPENHSIFWCDLIDNIVAEVHYTKLDEKSMIEEPNEENTSPLPAPPEIHQVSSQEKNIELKPLPPHLKYSYLDEAHKFPVIVARELTPQQEEKFLHVLRENKRAIGWSLADLVGISPPSVRAPNIPKGRS